MSSPSPKRNYPRPIFITDADDDLLFTDGDTGSRFGDEEYGGGGRGGALSPVSEDPGEYMDEEEVMMYEMIEAGVPPPPDGGWGWVIVFASFMCNLIVDGIAYTFGVFLDSFAEEYVPSGEGIGKVAWVGSLLSGVYLSVGPIVSALTNKFGCRIVCMSGAVVASVGFALSTLSPNLEVLMLTYGVIGGIGFGLIYLPAVVCVGYYFESRRALATGIAVCGSGVGTFVFAPVARLLLSSLDWRKANLIFAGLIFSCAIFGALMKPLELKREALAEDDGDEEEGGEKTKRNKSLFQRMAEDRKNQMEKGSLAGSAYFMVQLPDGTMERRMKMPINIDPGVHSNFNLDQLVPGTPITPNPTLPTITEGKSKEGGGSRSDSSHEGSAELKSPGESEGREQEEERGAEESRPLMSTTPAIAIPIPEPIAEERETDGSYDSADEAQLSSSARAAQRRHMRERRNSDGVYSMSPPSVRAEPIGRSPPKVVPVIGRSGSVAAPFSSRIGGMPRNGSAPNFTPGRSIPKNGSVPNFDRMARKHSYRAVPAGSFPRPPSRTNMNESRRNSGINAHLNVKNNNAANGNQEDDYSSLWSRGELNEGLIFSTSHRGSSSTQATTEPRHIIRPMSRKDIFYSGSIVHLPEFQSQKSINSYRQSVLNLPRLGGSMSWRQGDEGDGAPGSPTKAKAPLCPCLGGGAGSFSTALAQLMDFSLLKNPVFLFIAVSNVFGMLGFYVPFVFIIKSAEAKSVDPGEAAFLLSIIGIANTIGRVLTGLVSDLPQVNSLFMNNMCLLLSGICVGLVPFCPGYYSYVAVAISFGLCVSGYVSLTSIILVDLLGLDNLTNAFGLLILFRGAASIVGAPLAGAVRDAFQSYEIPFFLAGGFLIISALISFMIPCVVRYAPEKKVLQPLVLGGGFLEDIPEAAESASPNESTDLDKKEVAEQIESCV